MRKWEVKEPLGTPYLDVGGQESQQNQLLQNRHQQTYYHTIVLWTIWALHPLFLFYRLMKSMCLKLSHIITTKWLQYGSAQTTHHWNVCSDIVIQHNNHSFGPWSITPFTTSIIQFENERGAFWTYFKNVMTTSVIHCYQNIKHPAKFFGPKIKQQVQYQT